MERFKWIEWNLDKIATHGLTYDDVEHAFKHRLAAHQERDDGSYETVGVAPSGRVVFVIWRYDEEFDPLEHDGTVEVVFVITAY